MPSFLSLFLFLSFAPSWQEERQQEPPREFGSPYENLEPGQQALIDDWFRRFNELTGRQVDAESAYNDLPLSTKTTFEAVTHALMTSALTDASGNSLGTGLDRIDKIETVAGKIKGAGGDKQFRIYAILKPDARNVLEASQEFKRGRNNTVYHKGYPLSYRQQGGIPSIQFSMSKDGVYADVDVDYRSSGFPKALFNGHLTSSNSDVRAGNNHEKHVNRWAGLEDWWDNWFGLPFLRNEAGEEEDVDSLAIPAKPRKGDGRIADAVKDFFDAWLLEQNQVLAMGYVSKRAFNCLALDDDSDEPLDRGMAPYRLLLNLRDVNEALGRPAELSEIMVGVRLADPELRVLQQDHHAQFVLYDVPEDRALAFACENRNKTEPVSKSKRYGRYYASVLYVKGQTAKSGTLALLWAKEDGSWKIVAWESDPADDTSSVPDMRAEIASSPLPRVEGDAGFVAANRGFLTSWLIDKDYRTAIDYLGNPSLRCVDLFRDAGERQPNSPAQYWERLIAGLREVSEPLGRVGDLSEVLEPVELSDETLRIVVHAQENAFTLTELPDWIARELDCAARLAGAPTEEPPETPSYGNYYGTALRLRLMGEDPAVLYLIWAKEGDSWRVVSYDVPTP